MEVFEFAMKMEQDGKKYYLNQAEKTDLPELKNILFQLADDEEKHYLLFKAMHDGKEVKFDDATETSILSSVKNVFQVLKEQNANFDFNSDIVTVWRDAQEVEKKSEDFYRQKADETENPEYKKIWNRIADEEHRHWVTIENVIHFLQKPDQWLEDAEWSNIDNY